MANLHLWQKCTESTWWKLTKLKMIQLWKSSVKKVRWCVKFSQLTWRSKRRSKNSNNNSLLLLNLKQKTPQSNNQIKLTSRLTLRLMQKLLKNNFQISSSLKLNQMKKRSLLQIILTRLPTSSSQKKNQTKRKKRTTKLLLSKKPCQRSPKSDYMTTRVSLNWRTPIHTLIHQY